MGVQTGVRIRPETVDRIDAWRRNEPDLPTRTEAIRRLIERGLDR